MRQTTFLGKEELRFAVLHLQTEPSKDSEAVLDGGYHALQLRDAAVLPLEKKVIGEHGGIVLNPVKGLRAGHGAKQSNSYKRPETGGKRTTLSHASLARDSDIGLRACRPIPDVSM